MATLLVDKDEYDGGVENLPQSFGPMKWVNEEAWRRAEVLSANTSASARGLAFLGTIMANRGVGADGERYIPEQGWREFHEGKDRRVDQSYGVTNTFSNGGAAHGSHVEGFIGWVGFGGSCFQWNPELNISFAYAPSDMFPSGDNQRGAAMMTLAKECAEGMDRGDDMDSDDTERIDMDGFGSIEMGSDSQGDFITIRMGATTLAVSAIASVLSGMALY